MQLPGSGGQKSTALDERDKLANVTIASKGALSPCIIGKEGIGASVAYENERKFVDGIEAEVRVNIDCVFEGVNAHVNHYHGSEIAFEKKSTQPAGLVV